MSSTVSPQLRDIHAGLSGNVSRFLQSYDEAESRAGTLLVRDDLLHPEPAAKQRARGCCASAVFRMRGSAAEGGGKAGVSRD